MDLQQQFREDDSAVSPVIGVILMVAITVILAAVIASFVLGMGPDTATTPTATFSSEEIDGEDALKITMESGDTIDKASISIHGTANTTDDDDSNDLEDGSTWDEHQSDSDDTSELTAGSSVKVAIDDDYEVRLVYGEGDTTSTMQTFEA